MPASTNWVLVFAAAAAMSLLRSMFVILQPTVWRYDLGPKAIDDILLQRCSMQYSSNLQETIGCLGEIG